MPMTPLQRLKALFEGNDTHYGTHGEPVRDPTGQSLKWVIKPSAKTLKGKTTEAMWKAHVEGTKPLGVVPIRQNDTTIWGSIDYDVYGKDLTELIKKVEAAKFPLVPGRSKSGGLHLFCFTTEPVPAGTMHELLRDLAAALGIAGSEIFPKQSTLMTDRGDQGSWMIMPYYGDTYGDKIERQVGLRNNGGEIGLPEFVRIAEKARISPAQIDELKIRHLKAASPAQGSKGKRGKRGTNEEVGVPFGDGPPCLVHMIKEGGIKQGGQNNTLFHMGVYFKKKDINTWEQELERANQLYCVPPHPQTSIDQIIKSLRKKDYEYKCKDQPMVMHCDSILCRKRKFGVTGNSGAVMPVITSIKKLNSDPPIWFLEVEGAHIECTTDDLQRWDRFQKLLINVVHNPFGIIPQSEWLATIQEALSKMTETIEVGEDAGTAGEFHELLEMYLTNRQKGLKEEDMLSGRPWENVEEGRYYFSLGRLHRYLEREGLKGLNKPQIVTRIHELGGSHVVREVKTKKLNLHWIPSKVVQVTPTVSTPTLNERPI
jgi:hypothetical protein